jgi:cytochrome c oxidase cbb3-type subunit I
VASGPLCFSFGYTQGREYSEYVWFADVSLVLAVVCLLCNLVLTIANRAEKQLYVSVWYFVAALLWTACNYPIGNVMWHPATGAMPGLIDSIFLWFWGHNLPGLLITPLATGAAYFVIPRVAKSPLNSHTLSLAGFWMLVALYTHIGGHHVLQSPIPNWLKTVSVVDSIAMVIPVSIVVLNLWMTARQQGARIWGDPAARLVMGGVVWYLVTCIQGPLQSLPYLQRVTHFNNWTVGHAHIAMLGFGGYIALGAMWHIIPLVTGREIYSKRLVSLQFGLLTFGLTGFFLVLTTAGLIQGSAWNNGETVYRVLPELAPFMVSRAALGISILTGALVGLYNLIMTLRQGQELAAIELQQAEEAA